MRVGHFRLERRIDMLIKQGLPLDKSLVNGVQVVDGTNKPASNTESIMANLY